MAFPGSLPRRRLAAALLAAGLVVGLLADLPFLLERRVRARLVREAAAHGLALSVGRVRFAFPLALDMREVVLDGHGSSAVLARLTLRLRPAFSARRALAGFAVERGVVSLPGDLVVDLPRSSWKVERWDRSEVALAAARGPGRLGVRGAAGGVRVALLSLDLGALARVRFGGSEPVRLGTTNAVLQAERVGDAWSWDVVGDMRGARVAALENDSPSPRFGAPLDLSAAASGVLYPDARRVELACLNLATSGALLQAQGDVAVGEHDVAADGTVRMERASLSEILASSGIPLDGAGDLGTVSLEVTAAGHLQDPFSITVGQRLDFTPPKQVPKELTALRAPFVRTLDGPQGPHTVDLRPGAPGFVPLDEVPPVFVRALLLSEDAAFWGHPGIDLEEIPVAFAINWKRGEHARGASTISQQLAKNLFLSRRKSYGRKLQELALTLLLESTLGKRRILEIYLNVIEWGPNVYGLRSASRYYFDKEPRDLTPAEDAFLVAMIPGPMKYQASFRQGALTRRFASLVDSLLAKLRSVEAITDEEYEAALAEPLRFRGSPAASDAAEPGSPPEDLPAESPEPPGPSPEEPAPGT